MKKWIILILLILLTSINASAEYFRDVIVNTPSGIWTDSRAYSSLNLAIAAIGSAERDLYVAQEEVVTSLTIPENVRLHFLRSGTIANSGQLTINTKSIEAGNQQIFTGAGDIDFAIGSTVKSSWFSSASEAINITNDDQLTLVISDSSFINENCTVGNNVTLKWESPRNRLTISAGYTMSNIKNIEAGNYQLFAGAGDFDFLDGTILNLSWFSRLRSATTWIENEKVTIEVHEPATIDYDTTTSKNTHLRCIGPGNLITVDAGKTLTIGGTFDSGIYKVFSGTGDIAFNYHKEFYPEWWTDNDVPGTTDMTTAIQAAIDVANARGGGNINFLPTRYKVTSLTWRQNTSLIGMPSITGTSNEGTWLIGTAGNDVLTFEYDAVDDATNFRLFGVSISGGENQIVNTDQTTGVHIENCRLSGPVEAAISTRGFVQDWIIDNVSIIGGKYAWRHQNLTGLNGGINNLIDKSLFTKVTATGQTENAFRIEVALSNNVSWRDLVINHCVKTGFYLDGGVRGWTFYNFNTERNHYGGGKVVTTGSITSGTNTLTVASGTGISNGDTVTIRGANTYGTDFESTVASGGGTVNLVLTNNALNTVVNADVTNAIYDNFEFAANISSAASVAFYNFMGDTGIGGDNVRYDINCEHAWHITSVNSKFSSRGVYDPYHWFNSFGGEGLVKQPVDAALVVNTFRSTSFPSEGERSVIGSPDGGDITLGLVDSNADGTGTYGDLEVRKYDANRTQLLWLYGDNGIGPTGVGDFAVRGKITPNRDLYDAGIMLGTAAPVAGTYKKGDIIFDALPTAGGKIGWVCVTAGTPGTWKQFGVIDP